MLKKILKITVLGLLFWMPSVLQATPTLNPFLEAAINQTKIPTVYDGSYQKIPYPGGDVAADRGVCSDVVIRAYRAIGIDLQKNVHEDMRAAFASYPKQWGLKSPDSNIDHRRVPNLQTYFKRQHRELSVTKNPADYKAGDLVTWMLPGNLPHIGIVTQMRSADGQRPLMVHNIGRGPELEDMLFDYTITGHYGFLGQ